MITATSRQEEELWLQQARQGDTNAFARIVQAYQKPVYNLCYRTLGDPDEAEDATQEAFLRAYTNFSRYDPERRFLTWILSIASNHCIDRLRRRRQNWVSIDDELAGEQLVAPSESPYRSAERREQAEAIQGLLNRMAPDYRIPLVLLYWYDLSYEEIAATMNLSLAAVKSRLHRGRKQMADLMQAESRSSYVPTPTHSPAAVAG